MALVWGKATGATVREGRREGAFDLEETLLGGPEGLLIPDETGKDIEFINGVGACFDVDVKSALSSGPVSSVDDLLSRAAIPRPPLPLAEPRPRPPRLFRPLKAEPISPVLDHREAGVVVEFEFWGRRGLGAVVAIDD